MNNDEKNKQSGAKCSVMLIKAENNPLFKALTPVNVVDENTTASVWISHSINMEGLKHLVEHSSILPQCIDAYKTNIAGFGLGVRYKENIPETPEMKQEYDKAVRLLDLLSPEKSLKGLFEDVISEKETCGIAYVEVIRDFEGNVSQLDFVKETHSISKSVREETSIEIEFYYKGETVKRQKRFRKYRQQLNGKTVYFKEFGDPRIMDKRTGDYVTELDAKNHANEIIEFAIGTETYGKVRWLGQVLGIEGARKAEELNYRYFEEGRHTPLAIVVRGGTLSDESETNLKDYANSIKGENGQHAFLVLQIEDSQDSSGFENEKKPDVELKDLSPMLQKDELFQDYLSNSRKKVQSAFRLPDLYVGYTTDFNRATAQTAMEVTEEQVFQPERGNIEWIINNKLLNGFKFKFVEVYFKNPDISNPDDLQKILNVAERAGGLTPNKAKQIALEAIGEVSEDYEGNWGNIPLAVLQKLNIPTDQEGTVQKSKGSNDTELVAIMKEVRTILEKAGVTVV